MTRLPSLSESHLASMLNDCSIDAIIAVDIEWNIIAWNTTAENIYKKTRDQVLRKHIGGALALDDEMVEAVKNGLQGLKSFVPASKKYPHRMHVENHFIPLRDADGFIIGVMNIIHDVAHRIKAEQQLQFVNKQLERTLDELASFTYQTSNNIKAPIRHLYTAIEHMIKTEARNLSDGGKASFRRIQSSINRMDLLLDDLLRLAQISVVQKGENLVDLTALVTEIIDSLKAKIDEKGVKILLEDLCEVKGNREQLKLLFFHLLDNAIKFNDNRAPVVTLSCRKVEIAGGDFSAMEGGFLKVNVKDNGIGFDQSEAGKIFNMFERLPSSASFKGSGIGLAIVRKIMDAHNGFIQVDSAPGKGSSFHCFFPVH